MGGLDHRRIAEVFRRCFFRSHKTELVGGADEPMYEPRQDNRPARLWYRSDFAASALHEAAHWCIAGPRRRTQPDFGYDYAPPPRSTEAQARFFELELKAQSLESIFARAAGVAFTPSADNLDVDPTAFGKRLESAAAARTGVWMKTSPDPRALNFYRSLLKARASGGPVDGI